MILELKNIVKTFPGHHSGRTFPGWKPGENVTALDRVSLQVKRNEFLCIVGPSGCGKSTLLNLAAGLDTPSSGAIWFNEIDVPGPCPCRAMVFQEDALFPWKTVKQNVEFGLQLHGMPKTQRRMTAQRYIDLVGLSGSESKRPRQLSGGMKQRVQIARVLALNPSLLLMDEPFGALDEIQRTRMDLELLRIWEQETKTVIFITHSLEEALLLGDRIVMMSAHPGRVRCEVDVDLPRPRDPDDYLFIERKRELKSKLESCYQKVE